VSDVGQQLFVGVRRAPVQQHLDATSRPRPGTEDADRPRNDEVARRQVVIRPELAKSLDLRLELFDPLRTLDRLVVETPERLRGRADVRSAVFQLVDGVDQLAVR